MAEENVSQEFRWRKLDKTRNFFIEEIQQNHLISKKHKQVFKVFNYMKHLLILVSDVNIGIASSTVELKICLISAGIKKYNTIINKKR